MPRPSIRRLVRPQRGYPHLTVVRRNIYPALRPHRQKLNHGARDGNQVDSVLVHVWGDKESHGDWVLRVRRMVVGFRMRI